MTLKHLLLIALFCAVLSGTTASAQNLCPLGTPSDKLVCLIPQVFGVNGLVLDTLQARQFRNDFLSSNLTPLNSEIARQSALLPLASPSSGITFSWVSAAKAFTPSTDSFGPILGERAETIGKYRVFLGFTYQYFKFDSLDGVNLKKLPAVFPQPDNTFNAPTGVAACSATPATPPDSPANFGPCGYIRDVITVNTRLDLKIHQFTTFVTFGLTNRIDVSLVIPIENVRMGVFSSTTIVNNSNGLFHTFPIQNGICGDSNSNPPQLCLNHLFSSVGSSSGISDITLRVKGTAWKGERAALALGVDVRLPTGDGLNLLGSGAAGVKPFVVWSYRFRISPHVFVGYGANGSSLIAGDISTGKKERLPGQLTYSGGADVWLTKWFTGAFDLVGQQVFQARRTSVTTFKELGACLDTTGKCDPAKGFAPANMDQNLSQSTGTFNITNASVGLKMRPFARLLMTANVLIKLNDGGLRARVVPLAGVSYTF